MQNLDEFCLMLALPCGKDKNDFLDQRNSLNENFIKYLQEKQAAGIVNIPLNDNNQVRSLMLYISTLIQLEIQNIN